MLYVLGAGSAYPPNIIDNDLLDQLGSLDRRWLEAEVGIQSRRTALTTDYLKETGNLNPAAALAILTISSTQLGVEAAQKALTRAGITAEQVGLVLGESGTPVEVTPSEGQRIAGALGLKVPSYDVSSSTCSLMLQLDTLSNWRPEVVPDYVLLVSTNFPSARVNYRERNERVFFGDAASALVVSTKVPGRFVVQDTLFGTSTGYVDDLTVSRFGHIQLRDSLLSGFIKPKVDELLAIASAGSKLSFNNSYLIGPQFSLRMLEQIAREHAIDAEMNLHNVESHGCALGSSPAAVLADNWDRIRSAKDVLIANAGAGLSFGYVTLKS